MFLEFLLVEDDNEDVEIFTQAALDTGLPITIKRVTYCSEIFDVIKNGEVPDVLVLDGSLFDMTMTECIATVKADDLLKDLPMFILTGHSLHMREQCIAAGVTEYFEKPASMGTLKDIIRTIYETSLSLIKKSPRSGNV